MSEGAREGPREEEKEDEEDGQGVNKLKEMELGGREDSNSVSVRCTS